MDLAAVAAEVETMTTYDVTKGEYVEDEQERAKHRALGDTLGQRSGGGGAVLMNCFLFVRYDLSQERAVPVTLREDSRQERRMVWLMV